ncbi:MAG: hypothetical protein C5S41_09425 [Candidatus Methanomarinus sp.]|jgi:hypothetical protein|nr:MAG: hypothetical protein C5S41_09425 [ANME-2 cluster archaeon]
MSEKNNFRKKFLYPIDNGKYPGADIDGIKD